MLFSLLGKFCKSNIAEEHLQRMNFGLTGKTSYTQWCTLAYNLYVGGCTLKVESMPIFT